MPTYFESFVTDSYDFRANPPLLDKVVFTIDHIHQGGAGQYSTFDVVKYLVSQQIPVTIFIQCPDPLNLCANERRNAQLIYNLAPHLISFGIHSLSPGHSQSVQINNLDFINGIIGDITGLTPNILSYHGTGAGPETDINYAGIKYARGIKSTWSTARKDNLLDTPVMGLNRVNDAFDFTRLRNLAGLSATLFVHSAELLSGSTKKLVFDTMIRAVSDKRLLALPYVSAMQSDYSNYSISPITDTSQPCPLDNFFNNKIVQFLRINMRDGVNGSFQVTELQNFLNSIGHDAGIADGIFGPKTKLAVISFQIIEGLLADGIVGKNSRAVINAYCD